MSPVYINGVEQVAVHDLAGAAHNADTLANLNAKVSDGTLGLCRVEKLTVNYDDASPVAMVTLPAGYFPIAAAVEVKTVFNGTAPTLDLGYAANPDAYLESADVNLKAAAWDAYEITSWGNNLYIQPANNHYYPNVRGSSVDVIVTLAPDGSTQGVVDVYLFYIARP